MSIKNDGHYFCGVGRNRPDGSDETLTVVAVELEFYLLDRQRDAEGYLQPPCAPGTDDRNTQSQVYSVDNLNHFADVLNDIDELAQLQLIPADGAVAEASPVIRHEINEGGSVR